MLVALRLACAASWLLLLIPLLGRAGRSARWGGTCLVALASSAAAARWHVSLWQAVRESLRASDLYEARVWFKVLLAGLLLALVLWSMHWIRRTTEDDWVGRWVLLATATWLAYLLAWTGFLDDVLPPVLGRPLLRHGLELLWALVPFFRIALGKR